MPLGALENHEVLEQPRAVLIEGSHFDRAPCPAARRQKPVAVRRRAGRHFLHLTGLRGRLARNREWNDPSAVQKQDPADRPSEEQLAAPVLEQRVPAHQLRERQAAQDGAEHPRQDVHGSLAALLPPEGQVCPFRSFHAFDRRDIHPLLRREAGASWRRRAVGLEAR